MKLIIDIPEDVYKRTKFYKEFRDLNDCVITIKALENGTLLNEVLDKIRDEIEYEMNDLYRQKSMDLRNLTIIHACQRHIEIIDKYREEAAE